MVKLFRNCNIFTSTGEMIKDGKVFVVKGKIKAIGKDILAPEGTQNIDLGGGYLLPGLIDAHTHLGMEEEGVGQAGDDLNETSSPLTPQLRAIDAINPMDVAFADALAGGVTMVATGPGSANVLGGSFALLKTYGKCVDDMIVKTPIAIKAALGENPKRVYKKQNKAPATRMAIAALLRETLMEAQAYSKLKTKANLSAETRMKMEALQPVINKEIPLKVHAHRADDILTAIRIAKEFDIDITLDHCTEGDQIIEILYRERIPAIVGPSFTNRSKNELANKSFETVVRLHEKGIKVAITTDHPVVPIQYLTVCAALAVREGLSEVEALRAITLYPAQILGVDDRVGSIDVEKDADFAVFDYHPLDFRSKVLETYIEGERVYAK